MDYQKMWEQLKDEIRTDLKFHSSGVMQSMSEAIEGEAKCTQILKYMSDIEETQKDKQEVLNTKMKITLEFDIDDCESGFLMGVAKLIKDEKVLHQLALHFKNSDGWNDEWDIQSEICKNPYADEQTLNILVEDNESTVRYFVAKREDISQELFWKLSDDSDTLVISELLSNPKLPKEVLHHIINRIISGNFVFDPDVIERGKFAEKILNHSKITKSDARKIKEWSHNE
ncbi:MAG: hypothetical protein IJ220_01380 [Clostridia bacterium]|nr:hypothetical protein [Clostridia bacterium]